MNGLCKEPRQRSAYRREADEIDVKADIDTQMSAVGGKADVSWQELSGPFIANSAHCLQSNAVMKLVHGCKKSENSLRY
jgi:hypothetical protein